MNVQAVKESVDAYVDAVWEDVVEDIRALVRIESVEDLEHAGPGMPWGPEVRRALDCALDIAGRLGLEPHDCAGYLGYADLPGESDRQVATIAHADIVPVGEGWTVPPLDVTRREGYLLGRGVIDDKGPLVLSLYAAKFFADEVARSGERLPLTLRCIIGANEETSMGDVAWYLDHHEAPDFVFTPDANFPLINGEKGILHGHFELPWPGGGTLVDIQGGTVANAVAGSAGARLRCDASSLAGSAGISWTENHDGTVSLRAQGKGGHASMPEGTTSAIALLADYLLGHVELDADERRLLELARLVSATWDGVALGIATSDEKFGPLTCVGGTIAVVGGTVRMSVDVRYPTSTDAAGLVTALSEVASRFGATFVLDLNKDPFYTDPTAPEIEALLATYREYARADGQAFTIGGGTYARKFPRGCAFGPQDDSYPQPAWVGTEHGPDEGVGEETLRRALKIYIVAIARLMELYR